MKAIAFDLQHAFSEPNTNVSDPGNNAHFYYHYWPQAQEQTQFEPELPFCLYWLNSEAPAPSYGEDADHFQYLMNAFTDPRYIRVGDCPLLIVHDVTNIPGVLRFASSIRFKARRNGLKGVYLVSADDDPDNADPRSYLFDAKLSTSIIEPLPQAKSQINFLTKLAAFFAQYA